MDLYITTKLWPGNPDWGQPPKDFESTLTACRDSLSKLGLTFVDLYLIHTPLGGGHEGRLAQWRALVALQSEGACTSIGVSNYGARHLQEIAEAGLPMPAANQVSAAQCAPSVGGRGGGEGWEAGVGGRLVGCYCPHFGLELPAYQKCE